MWLLVLVSIALVLNAVYSGGSAWVFVWVVGLPLFLVAGSLAFGKASRGGGLFGSKALYAIGFVITLALMRMAMLGDGLEDRSRALMVSWVPAVTFCAWCRKKAAIENLPGEHSVSLCSSSDLVDTFS
jgi:hypothetical protein